MGSPESSSSLAVFYHIHLAVAAKTSPYCEILSQKENNLLIFKEKIIGIIWQEQSRLVLWAPVALGLGVIFYFFLETEPPFWVGITAIFVTLVAFRLAKTRNQGFLSVLFICLAIISLGFTSAQWRTALVSAPVLVRAIGPTTLEGRIDQLETRIKGVRVTLDKTRIIGVKPESTPQKIRIVLAGKQPSLFVGDWVRLRARLRPPPAPAAPGAFDFQRRFFFTGIGAVGFAYGKAVVTLSAENSGPQDLIYRGTAALSRLRNEIGRRVQGAFAGSEELAIGAVTRALMNGERGAIPEQVMDDFRDSGIAHLLAISGLHIGLVAGIVFVGLRGFLALFPSMALGYPIKKWAASAAILSALAYALIAGATVPTMRAFLMIGVVLAAVLFERRSLSLRLIAFAAFVILLIKPESLLGASFQLSFAAVTALVAAYEILSEKKWSRSGRGRGWAATFLLYIGGVALTTLIAGMATAPFAAFHFNRFADYSLAANLLAVPLTALWIMPWAVIAFALMPLGLEGLALAPMGAGVGFVLDIAGEVASWPGAVTLLPAMETGGIAAITLGGLWLCLWRQRWRWFGAIAIAAGMASLFWVQSPDILIDGKGKLLALKDNQGRLAVSSMKTAKFTRDVWFRRAAQGSGDNWDEMAKTAPLKCDDLGCIFTIRNKKVALVRKAGAVEEDCRSADILLSAVPVRIPCGNPVIVVDRFDLWRNGAHALWFDNDGWVRIETVNGSRGKRPWVLRPKRRPKTEKGPG